MLYLFCYGLILLLEIQFSQRITYYKQDRQGPQELSSLKSLQIQNPTPFSPLQPSELASLSNSSWQTRKERLNYSTNNGDIFEKAKMP